jgi:uncharacterized protein (TIGR00255 family)
MIYSMTGFAANTCEVATGTLSLELRSVNHRYLELQVRIDEELRAFEPMLREVVAARLGRGKVECRLVLHAQAGTATEMEVNNTALNRLATVSKAVSQFFPDSSPLSVAEILRWPGVLSTEPVPADELTKDVQALLKTTLDELTSSRAREGEKLKMLILERSAQIETLVDKVRPLLPMLLQSYQEKLATRLREAMQIADDERIRQELAIFAQKIDVDEELSRLTTHLQELRRVLTAGGVVGKRLDFLMQELNREANTLGSKSIASETSQVSMELKVLIEQMREQVQNIE